MTVPLMDAADTDIVKLQLGRPVWGGRAVVHRCATGHPTGHPTVIETEPRLPDGTPFPTLYYLTCPFAVAEVSTLESRGVMRELTTELEADDDLAAAYHRAHVDYLARRERIDHVPEIGGVSAGGMPSRVKCLHVLAAHSLAAGAGVNPIGDRVLDLLAPVWTSSTCGWAPT